jgi:hypothetical protein
VRMPGSPRWPEPDHAVPTPTTQDPEHRRNSNAGDDPCPSVHRPTSKINHHARRSHTHGRERSRLGCGLSEIVELMTPVVWLTVNRAAKEVIAPATHSEAQRMGIVLQKVLRWRASPVVVVLPLTREQLRQMRQWLLAVAAQRGLGTVRASAIADAVVRKLALGAPVAQAGRPWLCRDSVQG